MTYKRSKEFGGTGGNEFSDDLTEVCRLVGMKIRHGDYVDAVQCVWKMSDGSITEGQLHGGSGGNLSTFELEGDDAIIRVEGRSGDFVDSLTFFTKNGKDYGPYGGKGGNTFELRVEELMGLFGRSGSLLDAVGVFLPTEC